MTKPSPSLLADGPPFEFGIRVALALAFAVYAGTCFKEAFVQFRTVDFSPLNAALFTGAMSVISIGLFSLMIAFLYALRLRPVRRASGALPRAAAFLGAFSMFGVLLLDRRTDLPLVAQISASLLILAGNGFALYILPHLGRSFSILPESRELVTTGPYRLVRHPLYLAEAIAMVGVLIDFISPMAVLLFIAHCVFQLVRIHYEENVLRQTFPHYEIYAARTCRYIPLVY